MKLLTYKSFLGYYHNKYYTGGWEDVIYIKIGKPYQRVGENIVRRNVKVYSDELDANRVKTWL